MDKEQFKALRLAQGLTQAAMAKYLGVNIRSAQKWEYGERKIPDPVLKLLKLLARRKKYASNNSATTVGLGDSGGIQDGRESQPSDQLSRPASDPCGAQPELDATN